MCFAEGDHDFASFPVEEDYDVDPTDSYGLSQVLGEKIARSFASRTGADIYALRIGGVVEPQDYARFPGFLADPGKRRRDAWTYMDARDLGQIVDLCIEKDGLGFQILNAVNENIVAEVPTAEFLGRHVPTIPVTRAMDTFEGPIKPQAARRPWLPARV